MKMNRHTFKNYSNKFQFISNMQSTSTSKQWFFGLYCTLLLLCASALPSAGQNCPNFGWNDFTKSIVQPNLDCNKPGEVTIRYSNNVVGVDEVHYQFGSGTAGPWFHEVDAAAPGSTVKAEIPTSMSGKSLFVRVTTKCGTDTRSNVWNMGNIIAQKTETITLQSSSTPAGSGTGSSGGITVWLNGPAGFSEATFKLYKWHGTAVLASQRSTRPYEGVTFFNLEKGDYEVKVEAKPACTPTTTASNWDTDHFNLSKVIYVGSFNLQVTSIPARGTCTGGVKVEPSKVTGVQQMEYVLTTQADRNTPIQTFTANYPNFAHTFTGLPAGQYTVRATEKTGNSQVSSNFNVGNQNASPAVTVNHHTLRGVAEGEVNIRLDNTTEACPAKLTLTRDNTTSGLPFTTMVKNNITEENTLFEGLTEGNYTITAEYGGQSFSAKFGIAHSTMGYLYNRGVTQANSICDPSGSANWLLSGGFYYNPLEVKIVDRNTQNLVRKFTLPAGQTYFETKGLFPGDYTLTVGYEAANQFTTANFSIAPKDNVQGSLSFTLDDPTDFCGDQPMAKIAVNFVGAGGIENYPGTQKFMNGATFEIYDAEGNFLYSGNMPQLTGNAKSTIESPFAPNRGQIKVKPTCGYPILTYTLSSINGMKGAYLFSPDFTYRGCGSRGTNVDLRVLDTKNNVVPLITYTVKKKTGELIGTYEMKEGVNTAIFANMEPGDYDVEWYPQCKPDQKHQETFRVEDKVNETRREIRGAVCEDQGYIRIDFTSFRNINGWRYELIRKNDNKLMRVYGSVNSTVVSFERVPAGDYIVKAIPIVECGDITPGEFEVTVPAITAGSEISDPIYLWQRDADALPFQYVGKVRYYTRLPYSYVKWRVLDVSTNAEIKKGEVHPVANNTGTFPIVVEGLPHTYKIEFETPCGTYTRIDSLNLANRKQLPGFELTTIAGNTECNTTPSLTVKSRLKAAGLPDKASRIQLYKYVDKGDGYKWHFDQEVADANAIIETKTFENLDPGIQYYVNYFYDGTSDRQQIGIPANASTMSVPVYTSSFSPKGTAILTVIPNAGTPGSTMEVVVTDNQQNEIFNKTVSTTEATKIEVKKPATGFTVKTKVLNGCFKDKTFTSYLYPTTTPVFSFDTRTNRMQCKNDGEITMILPEAFHDVDQVHYTLKKITGTQYTDVAETTKPAEPKTFIGLEAGTYEISARATVFKDETGQPKVMDFKRNVQLTTPYRDGLYATVRPDYMVSTRSECAQGRIGLNIEKGSGRYRVFLKKTPDGVLPEPKELFTDGIYSSMRNKLWGENFKPGHYALTVTDGCMERDIPDAEILEMPNLASATLSRWYMNGDKRMKKELGEKVDSFLFQVKFDPSAFPASYQQTAYRSYEVQLVGKGENPDDTQWKSNWTSANDGRPTLDNYSKRFNNCDGVDILLRMKNCPGTLIRVPATAPVINMFYGSWQLLKCNTVQWIFTDGEIGRKYHLKVKNTTDNVVVYEKDITYTSREQYLTRDPELEFPSDKSYYLEMTPSDYCGNPVYHSPYNFNRVERIYRYSLDDGLIMSDCDGRRLAIYGWTDCKLPMKYFVYEVTATGENLVAQSGNYVPERWYSTYKFLKDHRYIIRVVEYGQPETTKIDLVDFTLNYRLPSGYKKSVDYLWSTQTMCGSAYDATKKAYNLNALHWYFGQADWTGVPAVEQKTYYTIPNMKIVATQKEAPHRKFVSTKVSRYNTFHMRHEAWKEELADGSLIDAAYAPEGEYTVVAQTDGCGEINLGDEYLGRPTIDLSASTVTSACDGKFTVTPKGTITYHGSTEEAEITSFYVQGDNANTTRNWGQSFDTYQRQFTLVVNMKRKSDGKTCTTTWPFSMSNYVLDFDQSQSLSMFCTDSGKGIIHMALKGGQPPYTYKLSTLSGTEIERQTVQGAVDFEHGALGQRFRITATDACGLTWIHQDVLLQDPAAISSSMTERKSYCAGDRVKMSARFFPGATYLWHLPDGSTKAGREIEFEAKTSSAGEYVVDIKLTTCTVTLYAHFTVRIVSIKEVSGTTVNQQACAGEPVEFALDPAEAEINGDATDEDDIEYQWERTATPEDEESWTPIRNAEERNLTYTAAAPGVYYVRRTAMIDECKAVSGHSKLTVIPGINVAMTPDEQLRTINDKNPFTLTAGIVTGNPNRTYQWQRSADKKHWVNIGTDETFTETKRFGNTVYYRRIVSAGACSIEGQPITVRFKKRWPAYINPQVRQRTLDD